MSNEPQTKTDAITRSVAAAKAARAASIEAGQRIADERAAAQAGEPPAPGATEIPPGR